MKRQLIIKISALLVLPLLFFNIQVHALSAPLTPETVNAWHWIDDTYISSIAKGDVDSDGNIEVITGGCYFDGLQSVAQLCIWNGANSALEKVQCWYWTSTTNINSLAVGDVDADGKTEIVTAGFYNDGLRNVAQLIVWTDSLTVDRLTAWFWTGDTTINSLALGDTDADGQIEIVTAGYFNDGNRNIAQLIVWAGSTLSVEKLTSWFWTGNTVINSVALGDVDGDSQTEIVTGGTFFDKTRDIAQLIAWKDTGTSIAVDRLTAWYWEHQTYITSVAVANVDADPQEEIVTSGYYFDGARWATQLCLWNGATMSVKNVQSWYWTSHTQILTVDVGDADLDGKNEVVTGGHFFDGSRWIAQLCVWSGDISTLKNVQSWYWTSDTNINSVLVGNVDSDAKMEIVTGGNYWNGFYGYAQLISWT